MARKLSGTPKSFRFSDDELEMLNQLKAKYGSYKAGIMAAIKLELGNEALTKDEVVAWIQALDVE
jgi:phage tail tube protein FII